MALTKTAEKRNISVKTNVFQLSYGVKIFFEESSINNTRTGENVFAAVFFEGL